MLVQEPQRNFTKLNYFKYVKGELHLVLVKNSKEEPIWKYRQDIQDNTPVLRSKVYTFGERYGILSKKEDERSKLKVQGSEWQLKTLPNGMPILRNSNFSTADKKHPKYLRLTEVYM